MPIITTPQRSLQIREQRELVRIVIDIDCDGTNNTVVGVKRLQQEVTRTAGNAVVRKDQTLLHSDYALTDFGPAIQTGLQNFANALDVKA
jgi:hypothetical protein